MTEFGTPSMTQHGAIRKALIKTGQEVFEMFLNKSAKPREEDFVGAKGIEDMYTAESIKEDRRRVEYVKASKEYEKHTSAGIVLENMLTEVMEESEWLLPENGEVYISHTTEFDDIIESGAHADAVVEMKTKDGTVIYFGLDFTTAEHPDRLNKKRNRYFDAIKRGKLFTVKYFQSDIDDYCGPLQDIPVFTVGIDRETLAKMCEDYGISRDLSKCYVQHMVTEEILHQLDENIAQASVQHGHESVLVEKLEIYREIMLEIAEKKNSLRPEDFEAKAAEDKTYTFIKKYF